MNDRMQAKIETCLELTVGKTALARATNFRKSVQKVTGISTERLKEIALIATSHQRLLKGETPEQILKELF